jgi:hypothetical protein
MGKLRVLIILSSCCSLLACSPRDFLTRRLASELILGSDAFKATQRFWLHTGPISNKAYLSPEYLVLQRRGWINASNIACPADVTPPPCWDVNLTPLGVETFKGLMQKNSAESRYFSVPAGRRQLMTVTGISREGAQAEVEFVWKWAPLNAVGIALYGDGVQYTSTVGFRRYDDGWRLLEGNQAQHHLGMDEALKGAEPER